MTEANNAVDVRRSVALFLGKDTFSACDHYSASLGRLEPCQAVLQLAADADASEWREQLRDSFQLFTAVSMQRLVDQQLLVDRPLESVPVVIVVHEDGVDRFAQLVEAVVDCAAEQNIGDLLQFVTITAVERSADVREKAARFHKGMATVDAMLRTRSRLETGVLAIADYWRGARIGSPEKTLCALARTALLLTLTEPDLHAGRLGHAWNGGLGGRTYWIGLSAYRADWLGLAAHLIYAQVVKAKIRRALETRGLSIVGDLTDGVYRSLLPGISARTAGSDDDRESQDAVATVAEYEKYAAPRILETVASRVRTISELVTVLEHLANRLRRDESAVPPAPVAALVPGAIVALSITPGIALVLLVVLAALALAWFALHRKGNGKGDGPREETSQTAQPENSQEPDVLCNPLLSDVLDDLRRELVAKLQSDDEARPVPTPTPAGALMGEQRYPFADMRKSEAAREALEDALPLTVGPLLLLALESGKWRTGEVCHQLVASQRTAIEAAERVLQQEFTAWVAWREEQRMCDRSFVQDVLYATPPPAGTPVSNYCMAPFGWDTRPLRSVDRCTLDDAIHFLYLVEADAIH